MLPRPAERYDIELSIAIDVADVYLSDVRSNRVVLMGIECSVAVTHRDLQIS